MRHKVGAAVELNWNLFLTVEGIFVCFYKYCRYSLEHGKSSDTGLKVQFKSVVLD